VLILGPAEPIVASTKDEIKDLITTCFAIFMLILFRCFATQKKSLKNIYQYKASSCEANHVISRKPTMTKINVHFLPAIFTEVRSVQYENRVKDHTGAIFSIHNQILLTYIEGEVLAPVVRTCLRNRQSCTFMIFDRV